MEMIVVGRAMPALLLTLYPSQRHALRCVNILSPSYAASLAVGTVRDPSEIA